MTLSRLEDVPESVRHLVEDEIAAARTGAFDRLFAVACGDAPFVAKFLDDDVRGLLHRRMRGGGRCGGRDAAGGGSLDDSISVIAG